MAETMASPMPALRLAWLICVLTAACAAPIAATLPEPLPTHAEASALWQVFDLELEPHGLTRASQAKLRDAWTVARCIVRQEAFWTVVDSLAVDRSPILVGVPPGTGLRQVAARQYLRWRDRFGPAPRLHIHGVGLEQAMEDEEVTATTEPGGNVVRLRRWRVGGPLQQLAVTLVHEWLHTLGFADPAQRRDVHSVVYGVEDTSLALASGAKCRELLEILYIERER